jgi:SWIM zinc finger
MTNILIPKKQKITKQQAIDKQERRILKLHEILYRVESQSKKGKFYSVIFKNGGPTSCNCPRFEYHKGIVCSHQYSLMAAIENGTVIDATDREEKLTTTISSKSWTEDDYSW